MIRLLISILLVSASIAHAAKPSKGDVKVRFLAESTPPDLGQIVLATADARSDPFDLPMNNLSRPQQPPARLFSVWSVAKNLSLTTIKLPEEGDAFIVLLLVSSKGGYEPVIMPAENSSFKAGDVYFYNNAKEPVLGLLGNTKFSLVPGKGTVVTPSGFGEQKYYHVMLGVREADQDKVIRSMKWPASKTMRNYVFFYMDPIKKRVTYRAVDEFMAPEAPKS